MSSRDHSPGSDAGLSALRQAIVFVASKAAMLERQTWDVSASALVLAERCIAVRAELEALERLEDRGAPGAASLALQKATAERRLQFLKAKCRELSRAIPKGGTTALDAVRIACFSAAMGSDGPHGLALERVVALVDRLATALLDRDAAHRLLADCAAAIAAVEHSPPSEGPRPDSIS